MNNQVITNTRIIQNRLTACGAPNATGVNINAKIHNPAHIPPYFSLNFISIFSYILIEAPEILIPAPDFLIPSFTIEATVDSLGVVPL